MKASEWKEKFAPLSEVRLSQSGKDRVVAALEREAALPGPERGTGTVKSTARGLIWWAGTVAVAAAVVAFAVFSHNHGRSLPPVNPGSVNSASHGAAGQNAGPVSLATIHMVSDRVGWATGQKGQVLRTEDGGATWRDVTPANVNGPTGAAVDLQGIDAAHAWLAAAPETINGSKPIVVYRTADGGRNWQETATGVTGTPQIRFLDQKTGFILVHQGAAAGEEGATLLRSDDGGANWKTVLTASPAAPTIPDNSIVGGDKNGFGFADAEDGYLTGYMGGSGILFYATHDGGRTWKSQKLPIPQGYYTTDDGSNESLPPAFFGTRDGILSVRLTQGTGQAMHKVMVFYVTHDVGRTWTPMSGVPDDENGLQWSFADVNHGFATYGSAIYRTADAGQHWTTVQPNVSLNGITALDFRTAEEGWAIVNGSLLETTDSGRTWKDLYHPPTPDRTVSYTQIQFRSLHMADDLVGWASALDGHVWHTADGGASWTDVTPNNIPGPTPATTSLAPFFLTGSANTMWVLDTRSDTAYRTTDGGAHWQKGQALKLSLVNDGAVDMSFIDQNHGWLMVSSGGLDQVGELFRSTNGGVTWTEVARTGQGGTLPSGGAIAFSPTVAGLGWLRPDPQALQVQGPPPYTPLYVTQDGGKTWKPASLPLPGGYENQPSAGHPYAYVGLPTFPSGADGTMSVTLFGGKYNQAVYLTTTDGGAHWTASKPLDVGSTWGTQMSWVSAGTGWVYVADGNNFYRTDDGGRSWTAVHPNQQFYQYLPKDTLQQLGEFGFAPDGQMGWATTLAGALTFTYDGGQTWGPPGKPGAATEASKLSLADLASGAGQIVNARSVRPQ